MAILVVVLAVLVVSYASSMRAYLQQRSHIDDLRSQIATSQKDITALEREKGRWKDDAFVETQARERFGWVLPGETSYQVIDRDGKPLQRRQLADRSRLRGRPAARRLVEEGAQQPGDRRPPREGLHARDQHRPAARRRRPPPRRRAGEHPARRRPATHRGRGIDARDIAVVAAQLGRPPRSIHDVGHRCPCGNPDVVATEPRLDDGTPFPTTFYLTCPRAASMIGTLEASGLMREMTERLGDDEELAAAYRSAHESYLAARAAIGEVPEIAGVSAGGMPDRVKCLHVLAGQSLAQGRGVNPLGDEVLDALGPWWSTGPCVAVEPEPSS